MPKEYSAAGLGPSGAAIVVMEQESKLVGGTAAFPWPDELRSAMVESLNGAYDRADMDFRIAEMAKAYAEGDWKSTAFAKRIYSAPDEDAPAAPSPPPAPAGSPTEFHLTPDQLDVCVSLIIDSLSPVPGITLLMRSAPDTITVSTEGGSVDVMVDRAYAAEPADADVLVLAEDITAATLANLRAANVIPHIN